MIRGEHFAIENESAGEFVTPWKWHHDYDLIYLAEVTFSPRKRNIIINMTAVLEGKRSII